MAGNQTIQDGGFQLLILLAELHVPRMWVEQHPDDPDSRVDICIVLFINYYLVINFCHLCVIYCLF